MQGTERTFALRNYMAPLLLPADLRSTPSGRVVLAEPSLNGQTHYQELFGHQIRTVTANSAYADITQLPFDNFVPPSQQLRVVSWQIARSVLPAAGRVVRIEDDRVTIAISPDHGVETGDRFRVMRSHKSAITNESLSPPETSILPTHLRADVVADDHIVALVVDSGLEQLWPHAAFDVGDLTLREGPTTPTVYISQPQFDMSLMSNDDAKKLRLLNRAQGHRVQGNMEHLAKTFQVAIINAMQKIGIRVIDSPGEATHVVGGGIAPANASPDVARFVLQLGVRENAASEFISSILPIALTTAEVENWRP
ncbi:MAG: hypothetical protein KDB11_29890 [Planctomycetales bacterium]|nr:hypothetical protein [Planctomycetales bacterium]